MCIRDRGGTDLFVVNTSKFLRQAEFTGGINVSNNLGIGISAAVTDKLEVSGAVRAIASSNNFSTGPEAAVMDFDTSQNIVRYGHINGASGSAKPIQFITGGTHRVRIAADGKVGVATDTPRATLDVEGDTRLKSYHEAPVTLTSSGQVVNIDLSKGQTFELTTTENIVEFRISNFVADMATSFTIKILQGSTARTVDIDDFKNSAGSASIPVNWPGGVVPTVTASANAVDIYSFMTFDGGDRLYGVVGGQNFL